MNNEVLILEKKEGETSFASLFPLKRYYKGSKVGHAGTLDKFASGMMICLVGKFTKLNALFSKMDKSYLAYIKLGFETTTLDYEGEIIKEAKLPTKENILNVLPNFLGKIMQVPPVYSALHVNGKRAYQEARKGNCIEMKAREVEIFKLDFVSLENDMLIIDTKVSSGTYIRSLARDIASAAGSCGHLVKLERYTIGPFTKDNYTTYPTEKNYTLNILKKVTKGSINFSNEYLYILKNGYFNKKGIIDITNDENGYYIVYIDNIFSAVVEKKESAYTIIAQIESC